MYGRSAFTPVLKAAAAAAAAGAATTRAVCAHKYMVETLLYAHSYLYFYQFGGFLKKKKKCG